MPQKGLMKLMVECPNTYREVLLSDPQIELFNLVKEREPIRAPEVADVLCISNESASTRLSQLFKKKYLKRVDRGCKSGGKSYEYSTVEL